MVSETVGQIKYLEQLRAEFRAETDVALVNYFNSSLGSRGLYNLDVIELDELINEFKRRDWDFSIISNKKGGVNLTYGKLVYLKEKKLYPVHEYLQVMVGEQVVIGEIVLRTRLWISVRILFPFNGWESSIGIPNQALATTRHFWGVDGNNTVRSNALDLLMKSYTKLKIIEKNIDQIVGLYDKIQIELKEVAKLDESDTKQQAIGSCWRGFYDNLNETFGLHISIYCEKQLIRIIRAYKADKRKIYINKEALKDGCVYWQELTNVKSENTSEIKGMFIKFIAIIKKSLSI